MHNPSITRATIIPHRIDRLSSELRIQPVLGSISTGLRDHLGTRSVVVPFALLPFYRFRYSLTHPGRYPFSSLHRKGLGPVQEKESSTAHFHNANLSEQKTAMRTRRGGGPSDNSYVCPNIPVCQISAKMHFYVNQPAFCWVGQSKELQTLSILKVLTLDRKQSTQNCKTHHQF